MTARASVRYTGSRETAFLPRLELSKLSPSPSPPLLEEEDENDAVCEPLSIFFVLSWMDLHMDWKQGMLLLAVVDTEVIDVVGWDKNAQATERVACIIELKEVISDCFWLCGG